MKRREFIATALPILPATAFLVSSCQPKSASHSENTDPCNDFANVSENDLKTRKKLGYVDASPRAESQCGNCNLWLPPKDGKACGGCMLFKGPVQTAGYCTYWAPQSK
ncbi:MAG: high-potential iron-sulfur protein [Bacteroidetes bacterium]|nr:high-potential iron-sulfur protein [Bacteroidota bacterium]